MLPEEADAVRQGAIEWADMMEEDPEWVSTDEFDDALNFYRWMRDDIMDEGPQPWKPEQLRNLVVFFKLCVREKRDGN